MFSFFKKKKISTKQPVEKEVIEKIVKNKQPKEIKHKERVERYVVIAYHKDREKGYRTKYVYNAFEARDNKELLANVKSFWQANEKGYVIEDIFIVEKQKEKRFLALITKGELRLPKVLATKCIELINE